MPEPVELAMQAALVAALRADGPLAALVGARVVDEPEQDIVFPYVRIYDIESAPADTSNTLAHDLTISIRAYTRKIATGGSGKVEARRIMGAIHDALHRQEASVTPAGWRLVELLQRTAVVREGDDAKTMEGVAVYAALVEPV